MTFPLDIPTSGSPEVVMNTNFQGLKWAGCYSNKASTTTGLVRGYHGGRWGAFAVADLDHTFGASTTTYVCVNRSTGALDFSTSATNYNDLANYARVETVVTGASGVTSVTDDRGGPGGVHGPLPASSVGNVVGPASATDGDIARFDGTTGKLLKAGLALDIDGTLAANSDAKVPSQKAVKTAIAAAVAGLSWKQAVRAATTAALTLATDLENGDAVDGVTLATGDRVLVKNQATASENGIYVVAASGAPTRASDADSGAELVNASVYVSEGTTNADTQWTCTTNATITVGSTSIAFAQLASGGAVAGSNKQVQYNASGSLGAEAGFEYDPATNTLTVQQAKLGAVDGEANGIAGDDEHWLYVSNDPSVVSGLGTAGKQLIRVNSYGSAGYGGNVHFCRYRGTKAAPTAVQSGDYFSSFGWRGWDSGAALSQSAAAWQVIATENWTAGAHGIKFRWEVTPNGSTTRGLGMELDSTGLTITGAVKPSSKSGQAIDIQVACSDESTALTAGTGKVTFRVPCAITLSEVRASLSVAQSTGSIFTVDINEGGTSILSTKLTIDNAEKTSTTAATAAVISDTSLADDAEITVDIDQVGDGTAKGLKITLIGKRT